MFTSHTSNIIDAAGFTIGGQSVLQMASRSVTASTDSVSASDNNKSILLNRAAGSTVTLPAATGSGNKYTFFVQTSASSGSYIIKVANSSDVMSGSALVGTDNSNAALYFNTASSSDTVTLNGTTTGGLAGAKVVLIDVASNLYRVEVSTSATGAAATPFSATV